jgi:RHS repeat-associated protein
VKRRKYLIVGAALLGMLGLLGYHFAKDLVREASMGDGKTISYRFDALGNLRNVTLADGTKIEYLVDASNRRIGRKINGKLVQAFLYQDQLRPIAELDGDSKIVSRFIYGTQVNVPEAMEKAGKTYRIITDDLGSPRLVIDVASGKIVQRLDYDEFGTVLNDTNPGFQPFGFSGGLYDPHTKLVSLGARDYDSFMGRWLTKDPIRFAGKQTNLYEYVGNDPINRRDPTGLHATVRKTPEGTEVTFHCPVRLPNRWPPSEADLPTPTMSPEPDTAMAQRGGMEGGGPRAPDVNIKMPDNHEHHVREAAREAGVSPPRIEPVR